jgi:hypothetical protein
MITMLAAWAGNSYAGPALVAVATVVLLARLRRRPPVPGNVEDAMPPASTAERGVPAEARQWQVELHELARTTRAELDTRLAALQQLLVEADRRIARLASLEGRVTEKSATPRPHFDPPPADREEAAGPRTAAIYAMADAGLNAAAIANRLREKLSEVETTLRLRG